MSHYLIIGKNFSNLRDKIISRGDTYTVLRDKVTIKDSTKKYKHEIRADFTSREALLETVRELPESYDGALTIYENYVLPTAWVCEELNLPGMTVAAAEACTDKFTMRTLFKNASEQISPDFAVVNSKEDVQAFAGSHDFPLILKPANLAKSLLVTKNHDIQELLRNYAKAVEQISEIYKRFAPHRQPKLIIEEFMEGSIHSVDAFIDRDGTPYILEQIVDYQTGYDIGYEDNFHYSRILPSKLSTADQEKLRHVAGLGVATLGMRSSPAHIEIIMTPNGPRIVEIGARNGGYRERMHELANGIDIVAAALDISKGTVPDIKASRNDSCAVLELFPKTPGDFKGLSHESELRVLPSLQYLSIKPKDGTFVGKSSDGFKMCAVIILSNKDSAQFNQDLAFVNDEVSVRTKLQ